MKQHRVRDAKALPSDPDKRPYIFVETRPDSWHEFTAIPTHAALEAWVKENFTPTHGVIGYADRAFRIGIIKDWKELEPITDKS